MTASRYTIREVLCDAPNCFNTEDLIGTTIAEVRRYARTRGWRCDKTGDWCSVHSGAGAVDSQTLAMSGELP